MSQCFLVGARKIDLTPLDEFRDINEIVSLPASFHFCCTITDCSASQYYHIKYIYMSEK